MGRVQLFSLFFLVLGSVPHANMCHARLEALPSFFPSSSAVAADDREELQPRDWLAVPTLR